MANAPKIITNNTYPAERIFSVHTALLDKQHHQHSLRKTVNDGKQKSNGSFLIVTAFYMWEMLKIR